MSTLVSFFFFFNDTAPTEIYTYLHTLSLHDALPIFPQIRAVAAISARRCRSRGRVRGPLERRQVVAPERAHRAQGARAHLGDAGAHAGTELLRRWHATGVPAGRHARLRLRQGAQGCRQEVALVRQSTRLNSSN